MRTKTVLAIVASLAGVLLLGSVFLPTLCRAREPANRVKCASNLRQIGAAMFRYADANDGVLPGSFAALVMGGDLVPEVFTCPSSNAERADSLQTLATQPTALICSYTYLGEGQIRATLTAKTLLLIESIDDHDGDGVNVLFGDGRVEFLAVSRKTPPAWWTNLQTDVKAGTRPIVIRP